MGEEDGKPKFGLDGKLRLTDEEALAYEPAIEDNLDSKLNIDEKYPELREPPNIAEGGDRIEVAQAHITRLEKALPDAMVDLAAREENPEAPLSYFVELDGLGSMSTEDMKRHIHEMREDLKALSRARWGH
jgi:hypothetical protein